MKLKYSNIFEAITKNAEEAADMQFRADLMLVLRDFFREQEASQAQIGQMLGIPQPRVSEFMTGKVNKFSSDNTAAPSEPWLTSAHNTQATHPDVQTQTYSTHAIAASVSTLAPALRSAHASTTPNAASDLTNAGPRYVAVLSRVGP
jgi:predicted XRE-type DNA-binding protein